MADISAKMVGELRAKTDAPMMECKKALIEASGDMVRAEEILRVKLGNKATKVRSFPHTNKSQHIITFHSLSISDTPHPPTPPHQTQKQKHTKCALTGRQPHCGRRIGHRKN